MPASKPHWETHSQKRTWVKTHASSCLVGSSIARICSLIISFCLMLKFVPFIALLALCVFAPFTSPLEAVYKVIHFHSPPFILSPFDLLIYLCFFTFFLAAPCFLPHTDLHVRMTVRKSRTEKEKKTYRMSRRRWTSLWLVVAKYPRGRVLMLDRVLQLNVAKEIKTRRNLILLRFKCEIWYFFFDDIIKKGWNEQLRFILHTNLIKKQ